ncbi:MAG: hypothetical protein P8L77_00410, partial [Gammaproteobacteria bacterium]|nr:hypothetical protein [Gammaproteobacteria bacterium]
MITNANLIIDQEFDKFLNRLESKQHFAFSRFNDGELHVIKNENFTCKQWQISKKSLNDFSNLLSASLSYKNDHYYIGLPCGCCESLDGFRAYLNKKFDLSKINQTFATLFTNAMYNRVRNELVPCIKKYPIVLIANKKTNLKSLDKQGFNVTKFFSVPMNAWQQHNVLLNDILEYAKSNRIKNHIFLFCAGPVSNILIHQIHKIYPANTYIDFGSSIDKELGLKRSDRNYLKLFGWKKFAKCYWDRPTETNQISCFSKDKD